jgi:membrane-associated phospholipid phosphatase
VSPFPKCWRDKSWTQVKSSLVDASEGEKKKRAELADAHSALNLGIVFSTVYLAILAIICVRFDIFPGPEFLVICFLIYTAYGRWTRRFVRDWFPFITLILTFEAMRTVADNLSSVVHIGELVSAEREIFGGIPTLVLQQLCRTSILDYLGAFFYSLHFILPIAFAFVLWKFCPREYWKFVCAFLVCSYSALVTAALYPTAPPWDAGLGVVRILLQVDRQIGVPFYRTIFDFFEANPYAAFPSLHSAYPWLVSLYSFKIKRAKALPILAIPVGVWFSAVYLGEHYVVDVIGGIAYATCAFFVTEKLFSRFSMSGAVKRLRGITSTLR